MRSTISRRVTAATPPGLRTPRLILALVAALTVCFSLASPSLAQAQQFDPSWSGTVTRKLVVDDRGDPTVIGSSQYTAFFDGTQAGGHADATERITTSSENVGNCAPNTAVYDASGSGQDAFGITPLGPGGGSYVIGTSGVQLNGTYTNSNVPCADASGPYQTNINVGNNASENEAEGTTSDPDSVEGSHTSHLNASTTVVVTWRMTRAPDRDQDGFRDSTDQCPDTYAPPTSTDGCPEDPDRDHDGFPNEGDECPDSYAPTTANGCPDDKPACGDAKDNDGDGATDFPADPGCTSAADTNEVDPPVCSDGRDNDADGNIDFPADRGCVSASDSDEEDCTIIGTPGSDALVGTSGNDVICGLGGDDGISGGGGDDILWGGAGNDRILGGTGDDTLAGEKGSDSLMGGAGNDGFNGGADHDVFRGGAGNDVMAGGKDYDTVIYLSAPHKMKVDLATGKASGEGSDRVALIEAVVGSQHDDVLKGTSRFDQLDGNAGSDTISGLSGPDLLSGGAGPDRLLGGAGEDMLVGGGGRNALNGGGQMDTCYSAHGGAISSCELKGNDADL
jgi:Ca2+-binding RTX toxin-like protein